MRAGTGEGDGGPDAPPAQPHRWRVFSSNFALSTSVVSNALRSAFRFAIDASILAQKSGAPKDKLTNRTSVSRAAVMISFAFVV